MDIKKFKFPEPNMALPADPVLLQEAIDRGFYGGHTYWNTLFSDIFFKGGSIVKNPDISLEFYNEAYGYLRAFMGTWECKHEEKEAISALILSEIIDEKATVETMKKLKNAGNVSGTE